MADLQHYSVHPRYQLMALIATLLMLFFGWDLIRGYSPELVFFFAVSLGALLWCVYTSFIDVEVTTDGLTYRAPWRAQRQVKFRQLVSVTENGRFTRVITLLYHPRLASGLLDLDDIESLHLPALQDQDALLAYLQARVPP